MIYDTLYRQHGPILFCMRLSDKFYFTDVDSLCKNKYFLEVLLLF